MLPCKWPLGQFSWSESIKRAMDRVHTTWAGIIKHLLDRTSPNIIFISSGKVILGLGFASPNITLPDQINMILVSVLSNKCIIDHVHATPLVIAIADGAGQLAHNHNLTTETLCSEHRPYQGGKFRICH